MTQIIEQFFDEVPAIIWEMELRADEWYFTRRYGEYRPENRRDVIGKSLFEILPKGHPVVQTILKGIQAKKYFTFIDSTTPGRLYQNRCKPILDDRGNVQRVLGVSMDITESLSPQISLLDEATQQVEVIKVNNNRSVQEIIASQDFFEHFFLAYQPIINFRQGCNSPGWVCGAEALIRLRVEDRIIAPDDFLPSIQSHGLSSALALWVIKRVSAEIGEIVRQNPDFCLSINLSVEDLLNTDVFAAISQVVTRESFPSASLHIEILELPDNLNIDQNSAITRVIYALRELGIKITIDDFGKQSSNFDRLTLLAADDFLKIDRSFIPNEIYGQQASICTAMVWVGKVFQLRLIAEGIETPEQANFMKTIGCDYGQGYFFYQPMDLESIRSMVGQEI
jgi:EAL domain-containing protein (putative c-di-GMP-specific phosphodiesterase class I)